MANTRFGLLQSTFSLIKKMDFFRPLPFTSSRGQSRPSHQRAVQVLKMEAGGECGEGPGAGSDHLGHSPGPGLLGCTNSGMCLNSPLP